MDDKLAITRRQTLMAMAALAFAPAFAKTAAETPGNSLYKLDARLTDQDGKAFDLASLRGKPVLVSMFYTSCQMVCPMLIETVHNTINALPAAERKEVQVLMVTFDPARDTVPVLKDAFAKRSCNSQWTLARTDDATTRKIAALLGIQYRKLSDGEYNHSTIVTLLDREGRIAGKTGKLGPADAAFVKQIRTELAGRG